MSNIPHGRLQTVVIGNDVTTIPSAFFQGASNLHKVTIGTGVNNIYDNAFCLCTGLDTIYALPSIAPTLGENVFLFTPSDKVVITTCGADYASVWGTEGFIYSTGSFSLTLGTNNNAWGSAFFLQNVDCQQTAIIQASPSANCTFLEWSDGNTDNPRTITLSENTTLTAIFAKTQANVNVLSNDSLWGEVTGGGTYAVGGEASLYAIATCGFRFSHWNDGDTNNPRTITLSDDTVFTAYFEPHNDTVIYVEVHDTTYIDIYIHDTAVVVDTVTLTEYITFYDTIFFPFNDTITIIDTVTLTEFVPVHDTTYVLVHDTTYIDFHDTTYITLTDTVTNTVYDTVTNTIYDTVTNTIYDTINNYFYDTTVVFSTDTLWLHDTVFVHDTIYIHDTIVVGVDEVDAVSAKIYTSRGHIVVDGAEGNHVWLYDVNGRVLATKQDEYTPLHFDVPASGAYMVKIGNHPARKVVVIR